MISPADDTQLLDVDAGFGEFFYGSFRRLMIGENGDDRVVFCHLTLLREETAPRETFADPLGRGNEPESPKRLSRPTKR